MCPTPLVVMVPASKLEAPVTASCPSRVALPFTSRVVSSWVAPLTSRVESSWVAPTTSRVDGRTTGPAPKGEVCWTVVLIHAKIVDC